MVLVMIVPSNNNNNNKILLDQKNNQATDTDGGDGVDDSMIPVTFTNNVSQINPLFRYFSDQNQKRPNMMMMMMMMMFAKTTTKTTAANKLKRYNAISIITNIILLVEMLSMAQAELCRASFNTSHFFDCPKLFIDAPTKEWCCGGNTNSPKCCEWSEREKETENAHSKYRWSFDSIVTFFMLKLVLSIIVSLVVYYVYIKVRICCQALCEDEDDDSGATTTFVRPPRSSSTSTTASSIHRRPMNGSNGLGNGRTAASYHQNRRCVPTQTHLPDVDENAPIDECSVMIEDCGLMLDNDNPPSYSEAIAASTTVNYNGNVATNTSHDPPPPSICSTTTNGVCRSTSLPSVSLASNNGTPTTTTTNGIMGGANSRQNSLRPITGQDHWDDQQQQQQQPQQQQHPPTPPPSYNMEEEEEELVVVGGTHKTQPPYNPEYADRNDMV